MKVPQSGESVKLNKGTVYEYISFLRSISELVFYSKHRVNCQNSPIPKLLNFKLCPCWVDNFYAKTTRKGTRKGRNKFRGNKLRRNGKDELRKTRNMERRLEDFKERLEIEIQQRKEKNR